MLPTDVLGVTCPSGTTANGSVDLTSFSSMVDFNPATGCAGPVVAVFGGLLEAGNILALPYAVQSIVTWVPNPGGSPRYYLSIQETITNFGITTDPWTVDLHASENQALGYSSQLASVSCAAATPCNSQLLPPMVAGVYNNSAGTDGLSIAISSGSVLTGSGKSWYPSWGANKDTHLNFGGQSFAPGGQLSFNWFVMPGSRQQAASFVTPIPSVASVSPAFRIQNLSISYPATITISGMGFETGATVSIPDITCTVTSVLSSQLQCLATIPSASGVIPSGLRNVSVSNPGNLAPGSLSNGFDLRRFTDVVGSDAAGISIWKATTAHATMYDVVPLVPTGIPGITTNGDGSQNFSPDLNVRRRDMARYIARARNEAAVTPPCVSNPAFGDVPCLDPDWGWIERIRIDGITAGCGGGNYCPETAIPRNQMAVFIEVGLNHAASNDPCPPAAFTDVACTDGFWKWIQRLTLDDHISAGCLVSPPKFCPTDLVTRRQMAVYLAVGWGY